MALKTEANEVDTPEDLFRRAQALVPVLRERAARTEQLRRIPPETVADLVASRMIRIGVPRRFGGLDVDYELGLEIAAELGRGCSAAAWCYSLWLVHAWLIGHWPREAQREVFGAGPDVLVSSAFFPGGATVEPVTGGLRLSGRWEFSSGCDAAAWVMLGAPGEQGPMWVLVPKANYKIVDTWFASGLCGSGSKDIVIDGAFVPEHRSLPEPFTTGGVGSTGWQLHKQGRYGMPVRCLLGWDLLAPLIGMAQAALDEFTRRYRGTSGAAKSAASVVTQIRLAEAAAEVEAARALMRQDVHGMLAKGAACAPVTPLEIAGYLRDRAFAARLCMQAVDRLFEVSGGHALFQSDPLQRIHRDAVAACHRDNLILDLAGQQYARLALEVDGA